MSRRWGKGKYKKWPKTCVACDAIITKGSKGKKRNTPKVCQRCRQHKIPREKEWGCTECMIGDGKTGIFNHQVECCPALKDE